MSHPSSNVRRLLLLVEEWQKERDEFSARESEGEDFPDPEEWQNSDDKGCLLLTDLARALQESSPAPKARAKRAITLTTPKGTKVRTATKSHYVVLGELTSGSIAPVAYHDDLASLQNYIAGTPVTWKGGERWIYDVRTGEQVESTPPTERQEN